MADLKPCKKDLFHRINAVSFALNDVQLFLDTHPDNKCALEFFQMCQNERNCALKEYAKHYGPLTIDTLDPAFCGGWNWIHSPWPWQKGDC